jgi:predicted RecB family nuclease
MPELKNTLRTCPKGHKYYKTTDCPACPVCEAERKPASGFLSLLGAPARRALENHGILSLKELTKYSEKEILSFHGIGKTTIPVLKKSLEEVGLTFKKT